MTKKADVIFRMRMIRAHVNRLLTDLEGAKADPNCAAYEMTALTLTECETRVAMIHLRAKEGDL